MTKEEWQTKREQIDGYLNELFMLWQIAEDDQMQTQMRYETLKVAEFKRIQVTQLLSTLSQSAEEAFSAHQNEMLNIR